MRKCVLCNSELDEKNNQYYCEKCISKMKYVKKMNMIDKAEKEICKKLYGRKVSKEDICKTVNVIRERVANNIDNFSSVPEVITAIQMSMIGLKYETQKNIGGIKVDFFIPEIKIILEIDGLIYHANNDEKFLRDRRIMHYVGEKWEIVHIDTDKIPKYTWNLRDALPFIITQRNEQWRFRDTELDSDFLMDFEKLERYLDRENKKYANPRLFKTNRKIGQNDSEQAFRN